MTYKNIIPFPDNDRMQEEAAEWLIRLDGGELSRQDRSKMREWLDSNPSHPAALEKLAVVWGQMDSLAVLAQLFPLEETVSSHRSKREWTRQRTFSAAMASVAGLGVLAASLLSLLSPGLPSHGTGSEPVELVYETRIGQQSEITLKDGSTVTLNTQSEVRVRFDEHQRAVFLTEGEAYFDVAKNPELPFVVFAGQGEVRAVGTAFNVRVRDQLVDVLVSEGTVEVSESRKSQKAPPAGAEKNTSSAIVLTEGGTARYQQQIEVFDYLPRQDLDHRLAWRTGNLAFQGETLEQVIEEVSRYTDTRISIVDDRIADLRIGGYFDISNIDPFLDALEAGFSIKYTRVSDDLIHLSARDEL